MSTVLRFPDESVGDVLARVVGGQPFVPVSEAAGVVVVDAPGAVTSATPPPSRF